MWVNKNFMNFSRLVVLFNSTLKIENELDMNIMVDIAGYSIFNRNIYYIDNDTIYDMNVDSDYVKQIIKLGLNIKNEIKNKNILLQNIPDDNKNAFLRLFYEIIIDEKYDFFLKTEYYLKNEKLKSYNSKIKESISNERYEDCIKIKKEI